ncbi:hypothetical protein LINGRAHAP2_LOCUS8445 [Linum grandiflorum]
MTHTESSTGGDATSGVLISTTTASSVSVFTDHYANPLYLSPGDNLTAPLVTVKLTNDNYHIWNRSVRVALGIKNKIAFVDGSLKRPDVSDSSFSAWNRCNFVVLGWILNSVSDDIAQSLISYDSAVAVWTDLKNRFSQGDAIRIANLQARIASCEQGDSTATQYFTNLKVLWEEFLQYRPVPVCDKFDDGLPCTVIRKVLEYQSQDYVIRFIRGLNATFSVVRSQLLLMDPLPDINSAFKCAVQLERQMKGAAVSSNVESIALAAGYQSGRGKAASASTLFCRYCKKDNHTIDDCLKLKNKKTRMAGQSNWSSNSSFAGSVVKEPGAQSLCGSAPLSRTSSVSDSSESLGVQSSMTPPSLSPDELARLRQILSQEFNGPTSVHANIAATSSSSINPGNFALSSLVFRPDEWIIDTGASNHICRSLTMFASYSPILPVPITLPDSSRMSATHAGTVCLGHGLQLRHVLYVPGFHFNLLSVSRLTTDMGVSVVFSAQHCHIQGPSSQMRIGIASPPQRSLHLLSSGFIFFTCFSVFFISHSSCSRHTP